MGANDWSMRARRWSGISGALLDEDIGNPFHGELRVLIIGRRLLAISYSGSVIRPVVESPEP